MITSCRGNSSTTSILKRAIKNMIGLNTVSNLKKGFRNTVRKIIIILILIIITSSKDL